MVRYCDYGHTVGAMLRITTIGVRILGRIRLFRVIKRRIAVNIRGKTLGVLAEVVCARQKACLWW